MTDTGAKEKEGDRSSGAKGRWLSGKEAKARKL
jgi:hypothetical protein